MPHSEAARADDDLLPHAVAAILVAHQQASRIAATVRSTLSIPGVDLVLVIDDGSLDNTAELARGAGAVVIRQSHRRGRASSLETAAAVVAMRDVEGEPPRALLLVESNLGSVAASAAPVVAAVLGGAADAVVALTDGGARQAGVAAGAARRAIMALSGWEPLQPLGRIRCLTREAFESALPLAHGVGVEVGLTLGPLESGRTVTEVHTDLRHRAARRMPGMLGRANQYRDVMIAISSRRMRTGLRSTQAAVGDALHPEGRHAAEDQQ